MKQWLVRRKDLRFSRPLSQDQLIEQIESGAVRVEDEICAASGYWFSIGEVEEVRKQLGDIHLHSMVSKSAEVTRSTTTSLTKIDAQILNLKPKKIIAPDVINPQATKLERDSSNEVKKSGYQAKLIGWLLCLIFFGTLALLWLGSR